MKIRRRLWLVGVMIFLLLGIILFNGYREFVRTERRISDIQKSWNHLRLAQEFTLQFSRLFGDFAVNLVSKQPSSEEFANKALFLDRILTEWEKLPSNDTRTEADDRLKQIKTTYNEVLKLMRTAQNLQAEGYRDDARDIFGDIYRKYHYEYQILEELLGKLRERNQLGIDRSIDSTFTLLNPRNFFQVKTGESRLLLRDWILAKKVNTTLAQQWINIIGYIVTSEDRYERRFVTRGFELKKQFKDWRDVRNRRRSAGNGDVKLGELNFDEIYQEALDQSLAVIQRLEADNISEAQSIITLQMKPTIQRLRARTDELRVNQSIQSIVATISNMIYFHLLLTTGISIFLGLAIILLIYHWGNQFLKAIEKLIGFSRKIGEGQFEQRITLETGDELEKLGGFLNIMAEQLEETTVSRTYLENIFNSMSEMLFVINGTGRIEEVNQALCDRLGYEKDDLLGESAETIFGDGSTFGSKTLTESIESGELQQEEIQLQPRSGDSFPVQMTGSLLREQGQGDKGYVCVGMDISMLKQALEEKETLLKEVHHRVKNNLQVILSMLRLQGRRIDDEGLLSTLEDSRRRINSMALIHEKLYEGSDISNLDFQEYVQELVGQIVDGYQYTDGALDVDIDIRTQPGSLNTVIPCGLIINELVTNSLKYAFNDGDGGRIGIEFFSENSHYTLVVEDDGIGVDPTVLEDSDTLGMRLVRSLSEGQLHGELEVTDINGTHVRIHFPKGA